MKKWFIKNWFILVNLLIILISYSFIYGKEGVVLAEVLLALWVMFQVVYFGYKWFKSN